MSFFDKLKKFFSTSIEPATKEIIRETNSFEKPKLEKHRQSHYKFDFIDGDRILKYEYYDIEIKGTQYQDFDISTLEINSSLFFEPELANEYDNKAIKVLHKDIFLGYVPKNNIQEMIRDYMDNTARHIDAFISEIDEDTNTIKMALGFYKDLTDVELSKMNYIDASLTKTTKKDSFDNSRQDNLLGISEGDNVNIDYDYETETYLVTDSCGEELGEINSSKSQKLQDYEDDDKEFHCIVKETDYNSAGNITCKIRIFIK